MSQRIIFSFLFTKLQKNQYQHIYNLEEISRKHYGKEFLCLIVHASFTAKVSVAHIGFG